MNSKLALLVQSPDFPNDYISFENGLMIHPCGEVLQFIWLEYKNHYRVYLNLYDGKEPYRDILVYAKGLTLDEAKSKAVKKFDKVFCVN